MGVQDAETSGRSTNTEDEKQTAGEEKTTTLQGTAPNGILDSKEATAAQNDEIPTAKRPEVREKAAELETTQRTTVDSTTAQADTEEAEEDPEDESKYLSGFKLGILSLGLCLTTFVIALDNTIIATAIPKITTVFNSLNDVGWYGSSYLLTTCSLQPSFGKVYTYFDVKYTYLFALVLFEVGSVICAAARNSPMFIVGRAIAGAGAAALFSGGMVSLSLFGVKTHICQEIGKKSVLQEKNLCFAWLRHWRIAVLYFSRYAC